MVMDIGGFLVRTADRTILIDAGMGTISDERRQGGGLPDSLRRHGVDFADVTDVVFTHLHFDHVGWATQKGRVMFPNATYRVHQADWDHFVLSPEAAPGAIRKLTPLEGQLETFDSEVELAPGLFARPAPGHSPGHTTFVVADQGERALVLGDAVHVLPELIDPGWRFVHDVDPEAAVEVRDRIVDAVAQTGEPIAASHFPGLRFGRLKTAAGRRHFTFI
jgi:glyoxylase-like metal-dependent hydrolase (beta-lactamase superfamily II)